MKKSILITVLFAVSTLLFAKENKKADSYKTHEVVSTGLTTAKDNVPVVYFIRDITPEALVKVYNATDYKAQGKTGVKVSTGEGDDSNYLRPALIKNLVKDELNATIVECNTAYGGNRSNNINHMKIAKDHGFLDVANGFDLLDEKGYMTIPVKGGKGIVCVNVMNRLSVDCDCDAHPAEPDMHDVGILASLDPVALDQACVDLVYKAKDSGSLIERIESRNGIHTLEHAEKISFGNRNYRLVEIK